MDVRYIDSKKKLSTKELMLYGCKSWTIKKVECQRIDAVVLEKTLESPLDCKIKLVNSKEINPEY